jgi:hypothetical protein
MTDTQKQPADVPAEMVDDLALFTRKIGDNSARGASALAERLAGWHHASAAYGREQGQWVPPELVKRWLSEPDSSVGIFERLIHVAEKAAAYGREQALKEPPTC